MRTMELYPSAMMIAGALLVSACATSQVGGEQKLPQTNVAKVQAGSPVCPSKWIAAGNNGAKADRYFQVSC